MPANKPSSDMLEWMSRLFIHPPINPPTTVPSPPVSVTESPHVASARFHEHPLVSSLLSSLPPEINAILFCMILASALPKASTRTWKWVIVRLTRRRSWFRRDDPRLCSRRDNHHHLSPMVQLHPFHLNSLVPPVPPPPPPPSIPPPPRERCVCVCVWCVCVCLFVCLFINKLYILKVILP